MAVDQPKWPVPPFPQVRAHIEEKSMTFADKALDPLREVRAILWTLLVSATVASVAANIAHALVTHGLTPAAVGPVLFAMLAPVALLGLFHLMAAWTRAAADRSTVFWFFLGAIVLLAGAAFRLSFAAIRDLAIGYGYGWADAALFPLILDGLIAVCTVGLVAATQPRRKAKAIRASLPQRVLAWWRGPSTTAEQPVHRLTQSAQAQAVHQSTKAAPEPVEQLVPQAAETAREPVVQADAPTVTSDDEVVHRPGAPVLQESETQPVHTTERPRLAAVHADAPAQSEAVQTPVVQQVRQRTTQEAEQAPVVQAVHRAQAKKVVQAGASELPASRIAEVYARLDAGWSQNEIASARVAAKRTIAKLVAAREALDTTAEEPEPAFA
ncbi:DUF2637 domain-containing protein [Gordonia sp. PP30]|uniref:DUF2637 domain-containing protein n=1 Tax=Gordonia sp. PP30 TaxID=2935861 RepID=UPI0020001D3E|nr:DUF2637 domain-containing protein [Gordonia sp. PP30]UQE74030.1 DUF2637 domain-containing protein [Gordonia sp. PP30]